MSWILISFAHATDLPPWIFSRWSPARKAMCERTTQTRWPTANFPSIQPYFTLITMLYLCIPTMFARQYIWHATSFDTHHSHTNCYIKVHVLYYSAQSQVGLWVHVYLLCLFVWLLSVGLLLCIVGYVQVHCSCAVYECIEVCVQLWLYGCNCVHTIDWEI